jgi:hypothetical protein
LSDILTKVSGPVTGDNGTKEVQAIEPISV